MSKAGRFSPVKKAFVQKDDAVSAVLQKLRSFLDANEPGMVHLLVNTWQTQGKAITYKELREALLRGDIDPEYLQQWIEDYSRFVTVNLQPAWEKAMEAAAAEIAAKYPEWRFDPYAIGVRDWATNRAAEFVTNISTTQMQGLRAVVQRAAVLENLNVDELARAIRPMVGLTHQQSVANLNYYNLLIENGTSKKRAQDLALRYAARQHRQRAYTIARTELAYAYNQGSYEGTKQAQKSGYMGDTVKIWCTAEDERVCAICGDLGENEHGIGMDEEFYYEIEDRNGNTIRRRINHKLNGPEIGMVPPAHPGCRCTVLYEEIGPPIRSSSKDTLDEIVEII